MNKKIKSYVENAYKNNKYRLVCQYNGISCEDLGQLILRNKVVAYELPKTQTLECAWNFRLHLASDEVLNFSSKCTSVGDWNEIGSLSIDLKQNTTEVGSGVFIKENIESFYITDYSMLVYEEDNVYSESGIYFVDDTGKELIIVAAPSPGAVSISIPTVNKKLKPEFSMSDYKRKTPANS